MSSKRFCDGCERELSDSNDARANPIKAVYGGTTFEIISVGFNGTGKGDVCRDCVFDAVASCDTRPRASRP